MATPKLSEDQIEQRLSFHPEWTRSGHIILRRFSFPSFASAIMFVNTVAYLAEKQNHHPDITVQWKNVTISISTHDSGGLTDKDFQLAQQIDRLM